MSNLDRKALLGLAVPLAKDVLSKLAGKEILSVLEKLEKKNKKKKWARSNETSGGGAVRTFILSVDDIIRIVKSLEDLGLLIDCATETVKNEIKKQEGRLPPALMTLMAASFIALMASSLTQPVASSLLRSFLEKESW